MIASKSRCLMTLLGLLAISIEGCLSTPNVPIKQGQKPLPAYALEPAQQRTHNVPGVNYLPSSANKAQPANYATNQRLPPLNRAQNFNTQPLKGDLVDKNNDKSNLKDKPQTFGKDTNAIPRVPSVKPATATGPVAQTVKPAQQLSSPADEILKQINVSGPMQTGASNVNINNNVSNIKVGNTKNENVNYGIPALHRERLQGSQIDARNRALSDIGLRYGVENPAYGSGFASNQRPIVYTNQPSPNYLFDEDDYFANNGGYGNGNGYADYKLSNKQENGDDPKPNQPKKCDKKKQKPTAEQVDLKNQLLDLASKATSSTIPDDSPMLKYNKETGAFEQVQVDPNAKLYKDKLQEALNALSAKKLSTKKLKKVLDGSSDDSNDNGLGQTEQDGGFRGSKSSDVGRNNPNQRTSDMGYLQQSRTRIPPNNANSYGSDTSYYQQTPKDQYVGSGSSNSPSYYRGSYIGNYPARMNQIDLSTLDEDQRRSLVDQVRAVLNDNLNRFNEVVSFSDEFLEQLLYVSDDELTPVESEFKHMILCNSDERHCRQNLNEPVQGQQHYDDSSPDAYESDPSHGAYDDQEENQQANQYYQQPEQDNQNYGYEQPEEAEGVADQGVGRSQYLGEPTDEQIEEDLVGRGGVGGPNNGDERHFSRQSSSDSYLYNHVAGGARNGVPLTPQKQQYAEQSSYLRTNQGPPAVSVRSSSVVEPDDGFYSGQAQRLPQQQLDQRQYQQPPRQPSNPSSQGATSNGSNKGNQVPSSRYPTQQTGESGLVKRPVSVGKPQFAPNTFQQGGGPQIQQQQQFNQQQTRVPVASSSNGLPTNTVARQNVNSGNRANMGAPATGGRILKLQQPTKQV